jgi:hypothetical protein
MNLFSDLFEYKESFMPYYNFFYFRKSPRGNTKIGITDIPWQRLRMQQQGTDEVIQFDHLWILKADSKIDVINFENSLKSLYSDQCIHKVTKKAGHTEWFSDVDFNKFNKQFKKHAKEYNVEFCKIGKTPYTATKLSLCPLKTPKTACMVWSEQFWKKITSS